jgi:hypothetical protein
MGLHEVPDLFAKRDMGRAEFKVQRRGTLFPSRQGGPDRGFNRGFTRDESGFQRFGKRHRRGYGADAANRGFELAV